MTEKQGLNRRSLLRGAGLLAAGSGVASAQGRSGGGAGRKPKNIIFLVSDGMSAGVLPMAQIFSRMVRGKDSVWHGLLTRPGAFHGQFDMASLNSVVTDSAAASSSWGSGVRIFNGMVNTLPDGRKLVPIASVARESKRRVGLVSTATITHATPAGFAAVERKRDDEHLIAPQYAGLVDIVMGGGRKFFDASLRKDKRDVIGEYRAKGYQVVFDRAELRQAAKGPKILGLFDESHVPYTVDHRNQPGLLEKIPTLAEMTTTALAALEGPSGFLLQVEGGRVDHAAHANDAAGLLWDQMAFDDALGVALEYAARRGDTLIVTTSDHGNSNPGLSGTGGEYGGTMASFKRVAAATCSYTELTKRLGGESKEGAPARTAEQVMSTVEGSLGVQLTKRQAAAVADRLAGKRDISLNRLLDSLNGVLGQVMCGHTGIGWVSGSHTADYTVATAFGPGSEHFHGLVRNVEAFERLTDLMGVKFRNPSMTESDAAKFAAAMPRARAHWA